MLSYAEKINLLLLCDLLDGLEIDSSVDRDAIRKAISSGNTWSLTWDVLPDYPEPIKDVVTETADILSMWRVLEHDFSQLSEADKELVSTNAGPGADIAFEGFDGNNDPHYGVACHLIQTMGRFDEFSKRGLNSHSSVSLQRYRRILKQYKAALKGVGKGFSAHDLIEILKIKT
ncbi:YfbU family protein [Paracoccus tegillarcae]|uniref:YfbU family protein n=1 Tax=Paracoccus tegillarcae TaxID=1529068 RepID=A0A2K9F645_9RHOB|nr:YfbU family protein [Paracoccus tegillarcae]AUH34641.1 hypothetical protein CUV01_15740 [Paracoccus tegillarcae]